MKHERVMTVAKFMCMIVFQYLETVEIPSTNFVLKRTLALLNIPSLRETTMNWEWAKWVLSICPMFCVCDRSRAASTSSRMYTGAGLKRSSAKISESATNDLKKTALAALANSKI